MKRKTTLFKSLLLAAGLCVGANTAWADAFVSALTTSTGTVGLEDNSNTFWQYHSMEYVVPDGEVYTVEMTNYTAGTGNFQNFNVVINNGTASYNGLGETEYLYLRNDNYGWATYYDNAKITNGFTNNNSEISDYWEAYRAAMAGAHVQMKVAHSGNQFYVKATITPTNTTQYPEFTYTYATTTVFGLDGLGFSLTIEGGHLVITSASSATLTSEERQTYFIDANQSVITTNKGDITSLINGDFQTNAAGWTGGTHCTWVKDRGWRGTAYENSHYETNSGDMKYTVYNMPAGTYKVVAAWRSTSGGTITPSIAETSGTTLTGVGDVFDPSADPVRTEINTNGVEMPNKENLGGFAGDNGHNWRWITATGTLATAGNLEIVFTAAGTSGWNAIDDVHLYCTSLDDTSYTTSLNNINGNTEVVNTDNASVVTCDITVTNPNAVFKSTSGAAITTAASESLNNCLYDNGSGWGIDKMVLYDSYDFTEYVVSHGSQNYHCYDATLYRSIPANTWCSLVIPFWPTASSLTRVYPSAFSDNTLTFSTLEKNTGCWNDEPMLIKSSSALTSIVGRRDGTYGSGVTYGDNSITAGDVTMNGTYTDITNVNDLSGTNYVLGTDNKLHKVNSAVNLAPFRAYFSIPEDSPVKANVIALNFGDTATGIAEIENGEVKAIVNGPIYNLAGQRLNDSQFTIHNSQLKRGIYIVGGKKVLVK